MLIYIMVVSHVRAAPCRPKEGEIVNILDYIPTGRENAISRQDLNNLMARKGYCERKVRDMISEINQNDNPNELIINLQDGKGYFRPAANEDGLVRIWLMQNKSRTGNCGKNVDAANRYLSRDKRKAPKPIDDIIKNQMDLSMFGIV